jgi:predicted metal-binding membrane protein
VIGMAWGMENMDVSADWLLMPSMVSWGVLDVALVFVMWALMMTAMMLPSAVPLLFLLFRIRRATSGWRRALFLCGAFAVGYLLAWTGFSALATLAQWGLQKMRLISPMMSSSSVYLSGALLWAAGAYQFSGLKSACLTRCRSPLTLLLTQRNQGGLGTLVTGLRQGANCVGCCWLLMALLLALGVMNLLWIAGLTVCVLLEIFLRRPQPLMRSTGVILLLWGLSVLTRQPQLIGQ